MASNLYIRTNKEEARKSDIKVIKANATLNSRNKKRNTDSKMLRLFSLPKIGLYSLENEEKRLLLVWGNISTPPMSCTGNSYVHSALREHIIHYRVGYGRNISTPRICCQPIW